MARQKSDGGLWNQIRNGIKQVLGTRTGSGTTEGADDVLKQNAEPATSEVQESAARATTEKRRRKDREQTRAITIHIDHELHGDIRKLAAQIQRPAEIMLRRVLRGVVTDGLLGKADKYVN